MGGIVFISLYKSATLIKRLQLMTGLHMTENLILMCPSGRRCLPRACGAINNCNCNHFKREHFLNQKFVNNPWNPEQRKSLSWETGTYTVCLSWDKFCTVIGSFCHVCAKAQSVPAAINTLGAYVLWFGSFVRVCFVSALKSCQLNHQGSKISHSFFLK